MSQHDPQPTLESAKEDAAEEPCGIIIIDKPAGPTSMDVVAIVRRKSSHGGKLRLRVGHAGTLDPLATGVLVVAVGRATKVIDRLMACDKRYETVIDLGAFTTTDDREGARQEIEPRAVPTRAQIIGALAGFEGAIRQRPPAFSAVKIAGQRAYDLARRGKAARAEPRQVHVHSIQVLEYQWPLLKLGIHCGKGFYVRGLARDLGQSLGTGGHCLEIRRTAVGPFETGMARQLDELPQHVSNSDLMSIEKALALTELYSVSALPAEP